MKAKVTGVSAWQGTPTGGVLDVEILGRYVDSAGNATVSHYTGELDPVGRKWVDPHTKVDLWLVVQGPDDPAGPRATFREVLYYGPNKSVTTTFSRVLVSSDLEGLVFDYAEPQAELPVGFGDAPLTMRAAQALLDEGDVKLAAMDAMLAETAEVTDVFRLATQSLDGLSGVQAQTETEWYGSTVPITGLTLTPGSGLTMSGAALLDEDGVLVTGYLPGGVLHGS